MMKQVLAIFALLVAGSHAATCTAALMGSQQTVGADTSTTVAAGATNRFAAGCVGGGAVTGVAFPAAAGRCTVVCDMSLFSTPTASAVKNAYVAFNHYDPTYGNGLIAFADVAQSADQAMQYGGAQSTCTGTSTAVPNNAVCEGANVMTFKVGIKYSEAATVAADSVGLSQVSEYTTAKRAVLECVTLAMFNDANCRIASNTQITVRNGITITKTVQSNSATTGSSAGGNLALGTLTVTHTIAYHNSVATSADMYTWSNTHEASDSALFTEFKAAALAMNTAAITSPYTNTGQDQLVAASSYAALSGTHITYLTSLADGTMTGTPFTAATSTDKITTTAGIAVAVDGTGARYIANGNQGSGDLACGTSVPNLGCQHGCDVGYVPSTSMSGVTSYVLPSAKGCGEASQTSTTNGLAESGMPGCTGGISIGAASYTASATARAFTAGTCVAAYSWTQTLTFPTAVMANQAAYDASTSDETQRIVECAYINAMKSGGCVMGSGAVSSATMTVLKGISLTSAWATGNVITMTASIDVSITSKSAIHTALGAPGATAALTAATMKTNIDAIETANSNYNTFTGTAAASIISAVGSLTPSFCALNEQTWDLTGVTLQSNSSTGNCGNFLANGGTCTPVCGTGYSAASGTVSCSATGVLTGYNCSVAPTPTPTASNTTCTYGATSTCATRVTQAVTISSLTASDYTGNLKSTYECGYAKSVTSTWCTATSGTVTYLSGVQISSSAAARRAATITFVMDVETTVMTAANVQTAVASGVTASALVSQMTAINTATGWSVTVPAEADITVATAAFAGAASGAGALVPSALAALAGVASLLMM